MAPKKKPEKEAPPKKTAAQRALEKAEKAAAAAASKKRKNPSPRKVTQKAARQSAAEPPAVEYESLEEEEPETDVASEVGEVGEEEVEGAQGGVDVPVRSRREEDVPLEIDQRIADFYRDNPMFYDLGHELYKKTALKEAKKKAFAESIGWTGKLCTCVN